MTRTRMVPALVIVLGLATIAGISLVQQRSVAGRDAQLKIANIKIELNQLQTAPFQASPTAGGSPRVARKLVGEQIPLGASIIAVADAFHAMVSERPYREAIEAGDALAELRRCSGTQFDPQVVTNFCALVPEGHEIPVGVA